MSKIVLFIVWFILIVRRVFADILQSTLIINSDWFHPIHLDTPWASWGRHMNIPSPDFYFQIPRSGLSLAITGRTFRFLLRTKTWCLDQYRLVCFQVKGQSYPCYIWDKCMCMMMSNWLWCRTESLWRVYGKTWVGYGQFSRVEQCSVLLVIDFSYCWFSVVGKRYSLVNLISRSDWCLNLKCSIFS